ncbi:MAG: EAL domain-containing protein, partial [Spirochaetes bacterium]|nr:EAL domain-containing protein [Spirochaetota bacterium]
PKGNLLYNYHRLGKHVPWPSNASSKGSPFSSSSPILSGLYLFENRPVILSSQVVTQNNGIGPNIGRFIFGNELDNSFLEELSELAGLPIELRILSEGETPFPTEPHMVVQNEQTLVSKGIPDCLGKVKFLLSVSVPREIYMGSFRSIRVFGFIFLIIPVLIIVIFFSSLRLLKSLHHLNRTLEQEIRNRTTELQCYRDILQNMNEGFLIVDKDQVIRDTNAAFTRILGYEKEELLGKRIDELHLGSFWDQIKSTDRWEGEIQCTHKNGSHSPIWFNMETLEDIRVGFFLDITQLKNIEERLNYMAYYDSLTGLPNRVLFQDRLKSAIARAQRRKSRIALLYMDLDHFKNVNDGYGHQVGDALLVQVAQRLTSLLRKEDTVCRLGGDEFTIILESIEKTKDASAVAQKILDSFKEPFKIDTLDLFIGTSVGIALYPFDGRTTEELVRFADAAMYEAKTLGRGQYRLVSGNSGVTSKKRIEMETLLRTALKDKRLELVYQPQIASNSLDHKNQWRITGVEALLRVYEGDNRLSPSEFMEIAEESGLIIPLGQWVLEQSCKDAAKWVDKGHRVMVAVNTSPRQFEKGEIIEQTIRALELSRLDPRFLTLELTESLFIRNTARTADIIKQLKDLGIGFAIDDFGTGYSSLLYVKTLPIDSLKIDKSFIDDLNTITHNKTMALAIISMARSFGLTSIAEGVETETQCKLLRSWGCDLLQGYHLYKPMTQSDFCSLLTTKELQG